MPPKQPRSRRASKCRSARNRSTIGSEVFGATGRYVPVDEEHPFRMLGADGDAYTVLEILLGDLACADDGAEGGDGAHPGRLVFDCPREREMSPHLASSPMLVRARFSRCAHGAERHHAASAMARIDY